MSSVDEERTAVGPGRVVWSVESPWSLLFGDDFTLVRRADRQQRLATPVSRTSEPMAKVFVPSHDSGPDLEARAAVHGRC